MDEKNLLTALKSILAQPTAPFHEYSVRAEIMRLLDGQPDIRLEIDHFGNLIAYYEAGDQPPRWAFGSHMDHPGWVKSLPEGDAEESEPETDDCRRRDGFTFLGGVPDGHLNSEADIKSFGEFAMWDLTTYKRENGRISSRACDDLIGCASIVATLLHLQEQKAPTSCVGMFTRAEEVGFVGAVELARQWPLGQDCVFVSIETSIPTANARMGSGPMVRVGDRLSIFDSDAIATLLKVAADEEIPVQRALLDRGSCEATALQAYGIRTAGISVPLGNYHNCAEHDRIKAEYVDFSDLKNLTRLLIAIAEGAPEGSLDAGTTQREKLEARAERYRPYAKASEPHFPQA